MMILNTRLAFIGAFACLASLALGGCDNSASQPLSPTASSLDGNWSRDGEVPGSSEQWNLTLTGTSIVAQGTWTGEACCSGLVTGTGNVVGDSVHVDLKFFDGATVTGTPRFTEHVDAVQATNDDLLGVAFRGTDSTAIHMHRAENVLLSAAGGA